MLLFFTRSTQHLQSNINLPIAHTEVKQFRDGELYIKVNQPFSDKEIWVITETGAPAENLLELFFLLNALVRNGATNINILFTYFGYARQAEAKQNEAATARVISNILKLFPLGRIIIIHVHDLTTMQSILKFENKIHYKFFIDIAKKFDIIAAPDRGAREFAQNVAEFTEKPIVFIKKIRPKQEKVIIQSINDETVNNKNILLVDDIISTGNTLIKASTMLKKFGARNISAAATHGIFSKGAIKKLESCPLNAIHITNTIQQSEKGGKFIKTYDIASFLESLITENTPG